MPKARIEESAARLQAQTEALAIFLAAEPTDGAAPAAPKKPLALKPLLTPKSKRVATKAMPKFKAKAEAAEHDSANVLDEFVRALLPRSILGRAGRPAGSTPLRVRTVFFRAVMFPLHCYPHIVLLLTPRVVSSSPLSS